ncbi:hypothetical protein A3H26_01300 [candidate division WWE3 bacterium RIFCSPLOWO2_12_FULL_36_10]|uniref:FtsK domain-containing protein n=1 Tax=candidate division WWE3 bacterium RIFCSPLOWO2_12_FULL_36_10 TaxID=1802630 RepID=A0A1F4VL24_UNCKA|nr:MAG: hypothetical protein A3H26_01300 [candidate division WWE3 bacterium RIFCSPLOWO2_12_FULL_36_10]
MAKRGRKRKIKLNIRSDILKSILSVVLLAGAGISLVSFFVPNYVLNAKIQHYLKLYFGYASLVIPAILLVWGLLYIRTINWKFVQLRVLFGLFGLLFSFSALLGSRGGLIGNKILSFLSSLVSVYGAGLLLLSVCGVSLILMLNLSLDDVFGFLTATAQKLFSLKSGKLKSKLDKADKKDEIRITSGTQTLDINNDEDEEIETRPSFEIIPSMSEPQGKKGMINEKDSQVVSLAPSALPYADKVWETPPLDLLADVSSIPVDRGDVKVRIKIIEDTLGSFGVIVKVADVNFGPSVTQYALETSSGTKITKIASLQYDLALALASPTGSVRIEAPIPGKSQIGIEVPNTTPTVVSFKSLLVSDAMKSAKSKLSIVLGSDVSGTARVYDISKMPHLLVAGSTGSGKSVFLHSLIFSLLFRCSPQECKFILIDPKRVELVHYRDIPHLLTPVVTDIDRATSVFNWAVNEMERRYKLFESARARNIDMYNEKSGFQALPYVIIVVDELSDIMVNDPTGVEKSIIRLAQLARATGIHLILTVQRPSTNVITGLIKANIPCRIAFNVTSQIDSRVIIDQPGAEKLLGKGDMLFVPPDASKPIRIQGSLVTDKEINQVAAYLKSVGGGVPEYNEDVLKQQEKSRSISSGGSSTDELFDEALDIVVSTGKASASYLQRRLSIGYSRAAKILDELEAKGVVTASKGSKPRDVLISDNQDKGLDLGYDKDSEMPNDENIL